jgi:hypothetical protein
LENDSTVLGYSPPPLRERVGVRVKREYWKAIGKRLNGFGIFPPSLEGEGWGEGEKVLLEGHWKTAQRYRDSF